MRRSLSGALFATVALVSVATPVSAVPTGTALVGAAIELYGAGVSEGAFDFPLETGQPVSINTLNVAPGQEVAFGDGSTMVVVTAGSVSHFPDCTMKMAWTAGHTYFHSSSGHPGARTVNDGSEPATLVLVHTAAANAPAPAAGDGHAHDHGGGGHGGGSPLPMAAGGHDDHGMSKVTGCPTAGTTAPSDSKGVGTAYNESTVMQQYDHQNLQVWKFTLAPGYSTDWHTHPGAVIALQTEGVLENWNGCKEKEVWDPGYSYFHSPGTHGRHQNMTTNKSDKPGSLIGVFFNVPPEYGSAFPPVIKSPPPAECPTAFTTY